MSVRTEKWPVLYNTILRVKNPDNPVGIVTLWTEKDVVKNFVEPLDYCAIGNLYAAAGINHIIRNVYANPHIRYLVMWGADLSASGLYFSKFMKNGVDNDYNIVEGKGQLEKELPLEAIDLFREKVELIDLRGKPTTEVVETIKKLDPKEPFIKEPQIFAPSVTKVEMKPSEQVGFVIRAPTVAQTWLKILNVVQNYGRTERTRYASNNELKEVLNLTAVVTDEDPSNVYFPHYLPFSPAELQQYYPEWMTSRRIPGTAYNYGDRWRKHFGIDQIDELKKLLKRRMFSKKLVAFTYDPKIDWPNADSSDTPCITQVFGRVEDGKFFLTVHVRSQDMFNGWPRNMFAARKMQKEIADYAELPMGALTMITHSAHLYADDWQPTEDVLKGYYMEELRYKPGFHFHIDPRGNWLIEVDYENKKIIAKLMTPDMQTVIKQYEGSDARDVQWQITDWETISMPDHAASIGIELARAEVAMQLGVEYRQDRPLDFSKKINLNKTEIISSAEKIAAPTRYIKHGKKSVPVK